MTFLAIIGAIVLSWFISDLIFANKKAQAISEQSSEMINKIHTEKSISRKAKYLEGYNKTFPFGEEQRKMEIRIIGELLLSEKYNLSQVGQIYTDYVVKLYNLFSDAPHHHSETVVRDIVQYSSEFEFHPEESEILANAINQKLYLIKEIEENHLSKEDSFSLTSNKLKNI
jgi:hypothetical protein